MWSLTQRSLDTIRSRHVYRTSNSPAGRVFRSSVPALRQPGSHRRQAQIIPDAYNLAIACLGLTRAVVADGALAGIEAVAEALAVGVIFWLFRHFYSVVRKIQGLGLGDVKFLAAATPWVGIAGIPMLLLVAALSALIAIGGMQISGQKLTRQTALPFGPFLAIGLLMALAVQQWLGLR